MIRFHQTRADDFPVNRYGVPDDEGVDAFEGPTADSSFFGGVDDILKKLGKSIEYLRAMKQCLLSIRSVPCVVSGILR